MTTCLLTIIALTIALGCIALGIGAYRRLTELERRIALLTPAERRIYALEEAVEEWRRALPPGRTPSPTTNTNPADERVGK